MKYSFIAAQYAANLADPTADAPTITQMCTWLKASKSGFYEWRGRPASATAKRHASLKAKILALFDASEGTYGYRRLHAALLRSGIDVGAELVRRLVRELGLVACRPLPWRTTTVRDDQHAPVGDLVERDFTATAPGAKLVGDITYIRTWEGWLYLAAVIDCCSNEIEVFYNRRRLHSGLGYRTPYEVRAEYSDRQLSA